jgi:UDP-2,4-diacetamido-2,4,6-trideoxy-beta-L-altropyranose hydrolase
MKVAFRVDSSSLIGSGHLMRCLTLAHELRHRGAEVLFLSREHPGHLIERVEKASFSLCRFPAPQAQSLSNPNDYATWLGVTQEQDAAQTLRALDNQRYDWMIVDHYGLDVAWEKAVRPLVEKILVIDDLANRYHDCDVLLDQNYFGDETFSRYQHLLSEPCKCLFGPDHALVQPEYAQLRSILPPPDGQIRRVLVFFGGSDSTEQTGKVLKVLSHSAFSRLAVDVVIGANYPNGEEIKNLVAQRPGTALYQNLPTLAGLSARADLVIGAGGATTWERMCIGLPSLIISIAENQDAPTASLAADGFQQSLSKGVDASSTEWHQAILHLIKEPATVLGLAQKASNLVDGLGTKRIACILFGTLIVNIKIRRITAADELLLLRWANDPEARMQSFNQKPISAEEHAQWFARKLNDPDSLILIGEDEHGLPLGLVRFDINREKKEALISISIDQSLRGLGLSTKLLKSALQYWHSIALNIKLIAEVRDSNRRSQRLFIQLQFKSARSRRVGALAFELEPLAIEHKSE